MSKSIFRTRHNGSDILIKATVEEMEALYADNKIDDYVDAEIFEIKNGILVEKVHGVVYRL